MSETPTEKPAPETDTSAETADSAPDTPGEKPAGTGRPGGARPALLVGGLALLVALGGIGGAWLLYRQQQTLTARLTGVENRTAGELSTLKSALDGLREQNARLTERLTRLDREQQDLAGALREILRRNTHLQQTWLVAEARYLIRLAGQRLALARDPATAIAALRAADARLKDVADPAILPVRKALAEDIDALQKIPMPDVTGLALRLGALIRDVDHLKLLRVRGEQEVKPDKADADIGKTGAPAKDWRELPAALWRDMQKLIVIRRHEGPVRPLLTPEQHFFLVQNLKLQLEQARLALLQGNAGLWRDSLDTARKWLKAWFDPADPATVHLEGALRELAGIEIAPELPPPSHSHEAISRYLAEHGTATPEQTKGADS